MELRIGHGYDIHRLVEGRKLILGAIDIPFHLGLLGHSDADCVCHAITDALLGALSLPNIGQFYPDTDPQTEGIPSVNILRNIYKKEITSRHYNIFNIDCTLVAQEPKLSPYISKMREKLCDALGLSVSQINIKATTNEGLDSIGKSHAIVCTAVCLLYKI